MKKILSLLMALVMLAALVACGGAPSSVSSVEESESESKSESSESEEESEEESEPAELGRWDALQATEEPFTLYVDFHSNTPSINEEPTEEAPTVFNSSRILAESWLADKPNVSIESR